MTTAEYPLSGFETHLKSLGLSYNLLAAMRRSWKEHGTDELTVAQLQAHAATLPMSMQSAFRSAWRKYASFVLETENRRLTHLANNPRGPSARKDAPTTYADLMPELTKHLPSFMASTGITVAELADLCLGDCRPGPSGLEMHCVPLAHRHRLDKKAVVHVLSMKALQEHGHPIMRWGYPSGPPSQPGPSGPISVPESPFLPARPIDVRAANYGSDDTDSMGADKIRAVLKAASKTTALLAKVAAPPAKTTTLRGAARAPTRVVYASTLDDEDFTEVGCKFELGCGHLAGLNGYCVAHVGEAALLQP